MLAEISMLRSEAAAVRVPLISRERTTQSFWRNLISAIADGRQRKADEYVKELSATPRTRNGGGKPRTQRRTANPSHRIPQAFGFSKSEAISRALRNT